MKYIIPSGTTCQIAIDDDKTPYETHTTKRRIVADCRDDTTQILLLAADGFVYRVPISMCREWKE